jgi:hypothetical protein
LSDDDVLKEMRDRILSDLSKADHVVVNAVARVSMNELLRGVAGLLGPCSLMRLEGERVGPQSVQKLANAWRMDRPVVLGCRPSQLLPLRLFGAYNDAYRIGRARTILPDLGFPLEDKGGRLKGLVLVLLKEDDSPTPDEFRRSTVYVLLGEHEATALAVAGRENDSAVERIGES